MRIRTFVCAIAFGGLLVPMFARADGMVISPPNYWVEETGQKAAILYEKGVETMVLSTSFQGNTKDFAWIVPTPSKPDVSKGTQEVFTNLQRLTQTFDDYQQPLGLGAGVKLENVGSSGVTVIEEKQVDYYDVAVLAATEKDALSNWLKDNGYNFPEAASYLLQEYINNHWYFVAMRVNPESLAFTNVSQQLRAGGATPVVLRFSTERIVYPLRISSALERTPVTVDPVSTVIEQPLPIATYVPGAFDQAISVTPGHTPVYLVGSNFPNRQGGISAHIKLRDTTEPYRSILSLHDGAGADRMQFRLGTDSTGTYMQFIQYPGTTGAVAWRTEQPVRIVPGVFYQVAVMWSADKQPEFYLNGEAKKTIAAYGETTWFGKDPEEGSKVVIGGRGASADPLQGDIDDVVVYNRLVYNGDLMNLNNNAAGTLNASQGLSGASFYAPFNASAIAVDGNGKALVQLSAFSGNAAIIKKPTPTIIAPVSSQRITLYVLTDERKDATGFSTQYANWFPKQTVRDLAFASAGAPLLSAGSKKLFVTVLTRTLSGTGTLDDVFFRTAATQETMGTSPGTTGAALDWKFWIFVGGCILLSSILLIFLLWRTRKPRSQPPYPPVQSQPPYPPYNSQ